jgi:DNA repair protein RadC
MSTSYANSQLSRTRIETKGVQYLSDGELLATLINSGTMNNSAINISQNILKKFNLRTLSVASIEELSKILGIKGGKAAQIAARFELPRRLENYQSEQKYKINNPEDVYRRLYPYMRENKRESFVEFCLDTKNQIIQETTISVGSLNAN